jgi:hypothetical protein
MALIKIQAFLYDLNSFFRIMNPGQLFREARVPAEFASDLDPEPSSFFLEGSGRAGRDALAAGNALVQIQNRPFAGQDNRPFPAGFNTGAALDAGFGGDLRAAGSDQTEVRYLGAGAGVRALGNGNPEIMVQLQRALRLFL